MVVGAILGLILRQSYVNRIEGLSIDRLGVMLGAKTKLKLQWYFYTDSIDVCHSIMQELRQNVLTNKNTRIIKIFSISITLGLWPQFIKSSINKVELLHNFLKIIIELGFTSKLLHLSRHVWYHIKDNFALFLTSKE